MVREFQDNRFSRDQLQPSFIFCYVNQFVMASKHTWLEQSNFLVVFSREKMGAEKSETGLVRCEKENLRDRNDVVLHCALLLLACYF